MTHITNDQLLSTTGMRQNYYKTQSSRLSHMARIHIWSVCLLMVTNFSNIHKICLPKPRECHQHRSRFYDIEKSRLIDIRDYRFPINQQNNNHYTGRWWIQNIAEEEMVRKSINKTFYGNPIERPDDGRSEPCDSTCSPFIFTLLLLQISS